MYDIYESWYKFRLAEAKGEEQKLSDRLHPVSYTHLDVYKRQLLRLHYRPTASKLSPSSVLAVVLLDVSNLYCLPHFIIT